MTRFEALGILPDKKITVLCRDKESKKLKQLWKVDVVTFVDQLPPNLSFKLVFNHENPKLGWLIKFYRLNLRDHHFYVGYLKPDKRKLKRFAKRFDLNLEPIAHRLNRLPSQ